MLIVLTYDVDFSSPDGVKRLRKVAKICESYGIRVQNSVFELDIHQAEFIGLKKKLISVIDSDLDSIRFYMLGNNFKRRIETIGKPTLLDQSTDYIL